MQAVTMLSNDTVTASVSVCEVEDAACIACGASPDACAYDAILWAERKGKAAG